MTDTESNSRLIWDKQQAYMAIVGAECRYLEAIRRDYKDNHILTKQECVQLARKIMNRVHGVNYDKASVERFIASP